MWRSLDANELKIWNNETQIYVHIISIYFVFVLTFRDANVRACSYGRPSKLILDPSAGIGLPD